MMNANWLVYIVTCMANPQKEQKAFALERI